MRSEQEKSDWLLDFYLDLSLKMNLEKKIILRWAQRLACNNRYTNLLWEYQRDLVESGRPERDSILGRIAWHELCRACTGGRRTGNRLNRIRTAKQRARSHGNR